VTTPPGHPGWGPFAEEFAAHAAASAYNAFYDRPAVLDLLGPVAGKRIVDAGCGPGLYAEELTRRGGIVVGFDQSPEMVAIASARLGQSAHFRVHDLPTPLSWLDDESFDLAVMALVIHHIDERVQALKEIRRVLRSEGALVLSTHHPTADWLRRGGSYFDVEVLEETWRTDWHVRFWRQPLERTCAEFRDAGFLIERLIEPLPVPAMADEYPGDFDKLNREPGFIAFRLVRAP
jgi:SAM-dependent methyltransferase